MKYISAACLCQVISVMLCSNEIHAPCQRFSAFSLPGQKGAIVTRK